MKADLEPPLRFAVTGVQNARDYLNRLPEGVELEMALTFMESAIFWINAYAAEKDVEILPSMKT